MAFKDRKDEHDRLTELVFGELEKMGFTTAMNGTEHTHSSFVKLLTMSFDETSKAIRFQPDGVACIGDINPMSLFVEVKNSMSIEKEAYGQYSKKYKSGEVVVLIFGPIGLTPDKVNDLKFQFIENIDLLNGNRTVEKIERVEYRYPVGDDGWIYPRKSKNGVQRGSGTPYREVDPYCLIDWQFFMDKINKRFFGMEVIGN